jgi:hypothetical protein
MARSSSYKARLHFSVARLTDLGLPVFQTKSDKSPATRRGFKEAQVDSDQVQRWRDNAMAGMPTGRKSGVVVLDLDIDEAKGVDGSQWLMSQEGKEGRLPRHPTVRTPRGGTHHYFKYPPDKTVRCSVGKLAVGVDVRADGGYVIVPDSESSIGNYNWEVPLWDIAPPDMPPWLLKLVADQTAEGLTTTETPPEGATKEAVEQEVERSIGLLRGARAGTRNHQLNTSAFRLGKMIGAGVLDEALITIRLLETAAQIGLGEAEARRTARSGMSAGKLRPWCPNAMNQELQRINRDYFFATEGKSALVFREDHDPVFGNRNLTRLYPAAFREQFGNRFVLQAMPGGSVKQSPLGKAWLSWSGKARIRQGNFCPWPRPAQ